VIRLDVHRILRDGLAGRLPAPPGSTPNALRADGRRIHSAGLTTRSLRGVGSMQ